MFRLYRHIMFVLLFFLLASPVWAADYGETKRLFEKAGISYMFETSHGYALFPTIGKAGFVLGGAYGKGRVYEQGKVIGTTSMIQATVGFQLGGAGYSQVVFFKDRRALLEFIGGNFEFGAEAQATVLVAKAGASANTTGSSASASGGKESAKVGSSGWYKGMKTYTITKGGLMYEASIGGQKFDFTPF